MTRRRLIGAATAWALATGAIPWGGAAAAQERIQDRARAAREALAHRDLSALLQGSGRVRLQLPGGEPSAALAAPQAAAALGAFLSRDRDASVTIAASGLTEGGMGFVELDRRYRVAGSKEVRTHRLLLAYRRRGGEWALVEIRVAP